MHDTFYLPDLTAEGREMVLRTHTSPCRSARCWRRAATSRCASSRRAGSIAAIDATHTPMFHQIEGLVIGKDIHLGHLKWTLETCLKAFFERDDIVLRLRPSYFPSPSLRSRSTRAIRGRMVAAWWAAAAMRRPFVDGTAGQRYGQRHVLRAAAMIRRNGRALPLAWASIASPC
jgi:hypothetical protein